jgi:type IV secretion system protein VirD4
MFNTKVKHGSYSLEDRDRKSRGRNKRLAITMLVTFVIAMSISTEYLAISLGFPASLGDGLFSIASIKIYAPYKFWIWIAQLIKNYGLENPEVSKYFMAGAFIQIIAFFIPPAILKAQLKGRKARALVEKIQGSARWADKEDIIESSLLPQPGKRSEGVYVGAWEDKKARKTLYLRHNGLEHILAYAPTRSGKGVGLVLPTLLSWPHSVLVLDIKGENYALTSRWRKQEAHNNILKFDPLDTTGTAARFNPLNEIRLETEYEHGDIENMALLLADPDGTASRGNQKHWIDTAGSLIVALLYHLLYMAKYGPVLGVNADGSANRGEPFEPTLEKLRFMFADAGGKDFKSTLREIILYAHMPDYSRGWTDADGKPSLTHPIAASNANEALQRPDNEAGSVLSTAANTLKLFVDPVIAANTSNATFKLTDLTMRENSPTSLYICIPPAQINRLVPLVRILVTQIVTILASELEYKDGKAKSKNKNRLLLMLDEFPTLGNMEIFETALAFVAGYGLKAYIIVQDLAQLYKRYTEKESIVSNTHVQVAYAPNKIETAKILSEILGNTTIITEVKSKSIQKGVTTYNITEQEKQRPLLTPNEVMGLKGPLKNKEGLIEEPGDMIIKVSGFNPILGKQILYFKDPEFLRRAKLQMVEKSDILLNAEAKAAPLEQRKESGKKSEENDQARTAAAAAAPDGVTGRGNDAPRVTDAPDIIAEDVKISNSNEISSEYMDFISQLKNPFADDIEKLSSDKSSFLFFKQEEKPFEENVYNDDELYEGNEDERYTGDEPDVSEKPEIEMDENGQDFFGEYIKVDKSYWQDDEEEIDEIPIADIAPAETAV